jgi:hypothetical protein
MLHYTCVYQHCTYATGLIMTSPPPLVLSRPFCVIHSATFRNVWPMDTPNHVHCPIHSVRFAAPCKNRITTCDSFAKQSTCHKTLNYYLEVLMEKCWWTVSLRKRVKMGAPVWLWCLFTAHANLLLQTQTHFCEVDLAACVIHATENCIHCHFVKY